MYLFKISLKLSIYLVIRTLLFKIMLVEKFKFMKGSAMIETAISIPFILLMISGIINIGETIWETSIFLDASRTSARNLVFDCAGGSGSATFAAIKQGNLSTNHSGNWTNNSSSSSSTTYDGLSIPIQSFNISNNSSFCRLCAYAPSLFSVTTTGIFTVPTCSTAATYY